MSAAVLNDPPSTVLDEDVAELESTHVKIGWFARRRLERELAGYNLTVPQYIALRCTQHNRQGCSMSELADASYQVSATMTGIVDRLAEGGLVHRERDPNDRRTLRVVLTPEGERLIEEISARKRDWIRQILSEIPSEERRVVIELFQRYLSVLQKTEAGE